MLINLVQDGAGSTRDLVHLRVELLDQKPMEGNEYYRTGGYEYYRSQSGQRCRQSDSERARSSSRGGRVGAHEVGSAVGGRRT